MHHRLTSRSIHARTTNNVTSRLRPFLLPIILFSSSTSQLQPALALSSSSSTITTSTIDTPNKIHHKITETAQIQSAIQPPPTPFSQVKKLARASSNKTQFSSNYFRSWRHWSRIAVSHIRYSLSQNLPCPVDEDATCDLEFQLGVAADNGAMPSFESAGARSGYAVDFFCRAILLADLIVRYVEFHDGTEMHDEIPDYFANGLQEIFQRPTCHLTSIGGGPGYDYVGLSLVNSYQSMLEDSNAASNKHHLSTSIHATILDYEEGWYDLVDVMSYATKECLDFDKTCNKDDDDSSSESTSSWKNSCNWGGKCDITKTMTDPANAACLAQVETTDLWTCQYCVAENAELLRGSDFVFFRDLLAMAKEGSVFLFTETTHRLWPEFVGIAEELSHGFEVTFPRIIGRKGTQMVLRKKFGAITGVEQKHLCANFILDRDNHERKIENGYARQTRKVRGAKY